MGTSQIVKTLRDLRIESRLPKWKPEIIELSLSLEIWFLLWVESFPAKRSLEGSLVRLLHRINEDSQLISVLTKDMSLCYLNIINLYPDPFTGLRTGRTIKDLLVKAGLNCSTDYINCLSQLSTLLNWFKRVPFNLGGSVLEDFKKRATTEGPLLDASLVTELRLVFEEWFANFKHIALPKHGSGATSDAGRTLSCKYEKVCFTQLSQMSLRNPDYTGICDGELVTEYSPAQVAEVPKSFGTNRIICMEPAALQYYQHGVQISLYEYVKHNHVGRWINFVDQEFNRELCRSATRNELSTIDLSNASDSLYLRTWKPVFQGFPLWKFIIGSRSKHYQIDNDKFESTIIAPMGSAVCFAILSICCALVAEVAYRRVKGRASKGYSSGVSIFGDDIIVPNDVAPVCFDILEQLGMTPNKEKSYVGGLYHESCGVEEFNNCEVFRLKHPRRLLPLIPTVEDVDSLVDLCNSLHFRSFYLARRHLLMKIMPVKVKGTRIPFYRFCHWDETGLLPARPNGGLDVRYSRTLHRNVGSYYCVINIADPSKWDHVVYFTNIRPRSRAERLVSHHGYDELPDPCVVISQSYSAGRLRKKIKRVKYLA